MEAKKTPKANLEKRKGLYFEIGMVSILVIVLLIINFKSYANEVKEVSMRTAESEIEDVIMNTQEEEKTPPPPPEEPEQVVTDLKIVDNNTETVDIMVDAGDDMNKAQQEFVKVEVEEEEEEEEEQIWTVVEEDPEFPGGMEALGRYLAENIKYPQLAKENGITGKCFVTFVVEKDGSVANVKVLRDIGGGCGAEAVRVVKAMPKWKPGKQRTKPVRTQFNLPITFNLK